MMHNEHTMTLERMQRMMITGNTRLMLKGGWLPKFMIRKHYIKLMEYFDGMFGDGADKEFSQGIVRTAMWNKIHNLLPMMRILLVTDKSELAEERFKHYYGRDYEGFEDSKLIDAEIERLRKRFHTMFYKKDMPKEYDSDVTFENVIQGVEVVLDKPYLPRDKVTLYQFKIYHEQTKKRISELNNK